MPVTVRTLEGYLRRFGWNRYQTKREEGEREGLILTSWGGVSGEYILSIDPIEEKQVLIFHVPRILSAPLDGTPSNCLLELLIALGRINYEIILGKFSYDPRDGEVRFSLTLPTDRSNFTYEQFKHCMEVIVRTVEIHRPLLQQIARGEKTHRDVGETDELVLALLRRLLDGSL